VVGQEAYPFSAIGVGVPATTGVQGVIRIDSIHCGVGNGQLWMSPRPWPWFSLYNRNNAVVVQGTPTEWSQFGQGAAPTGTGSANGGSLYLDPTPDDAYTIICNTTCFPIALVDDTTVEAIPYLWTDAVPFFAAYYALLSAQSGARQAEAARMFEMYTQFNERARIRAEEVFPQPRGPENRYAWLILPADNAVDSGSVTCSWPTTSAKIAGRYLR
jgi:hypothetical protein